MRTAFVTGCATGFGHALAVRLLAEGWRVVASAPHLEAWPETLGHPRPELSVHTVDVRDPAAIQRAADAAGDVDVLINNAGYALFATQEEGDVDAVRDLFDVNVLGPIRVTQALLPSLRRRRGVIVQMSSLAGRTTFAESGFYAATKHALEAISEALIQEVGPLGVRLRVVEPGAFDTGFLRAASQASMPPPSTSPYAALRTTWDQRREEVLAEPQDPTLVVDAILASLDDPSPVQRLVVGQDARRILHLREALGPDAWWRLAADRAGAPHPTSEPDDVPPPELLLMLPEHDPRWKRAVLAYTHHHLGHWAETEVGRRALHALSSVVSRQHPTGE